MYKIRLMNEFLHGPIWVLNSDGVSVWKYPLIEQDTMLSELNQTAKQLFDSYYEFDSHNEPCWFNHEKEKVEKSTMIELISRIKKRLDEINDGSFTIEDLMLYKEKTFEFDETKEVFNLIASLLEKYLCYI